MQNNSEMVEQPPSSVHKNNKYIIDFIQRRRNLPHWQMPGSIYFITYRTYQGLILDDKSKQIIYDNIIYYSKYKYRLFSFVIMPDHVHIILQPSEIKKGSYTDLADIMKSIKGFAAKEILKVLKENAQTGASELPKHVFQSESYDRIIRDEFELNEKLNYILNNPIKWGLTTDGFEYEWFYLNK